MVANIDRLFSKPSTKLRYICDRYMIKGPKHVLVKGSRTFLQSNLYAVS